MAEAENQDEPVNAVDESPAEESGVEESSVEESSPTDTIKAAAETVTKAAAKVVTKVVDTVKDAVGSDEAVDDDAGRTSRKVREGTVVSNKMDKTAVVAVVSRSPHPKYKKMILQTNKLYAHDETNDVNIGDRVRVMETRALSKKKRWRITDVLERAK